MIEKEEGRKNTKSFRIFVNESHKMISSCQIQVTEIVLHLKILGDEKY